MSSHKTTLSAEVRLNRMLKLIIYVLLLVIVLLAIMALKNATKNTTVLVPYSVIASKANIEVTGVLDEDVEYLKRLVMADLQLIANFSPEYIERNIAILQFRLMPDAWAKFSDEISNDVEFFKKSQISQVFFPIRTEFVIGEKIFRVTGNLVRFSGDQVLSNIEYVYDIKYDLVAPNEYRISSLKGSTRQKASEVPKLKESDSKEK